MHRLAAVLVLHAVAAALWVITAAGCAGRGHLATPSGGPEVTISGATDSSVRGACVAKLAERGYQITVNDPGRIVGE
jgi:hypothetical protein